MKMFLLWTLVIFITIGGIKGRPNIRRLENSADRLLSAANVKSYYQQALSNCDSPTPPPMYRMFLLNRTITCNDGTSAGFYIRKSYGSRKWIIFLEGGWFCYDKRSCDMRWNSARMLMSSVRWPEARYVGGIMSPDPEENPYWWNANHVLIPYCSSDAWTGTSFPNHSSKYAFLGAYIVEEVMKQLQGHGLRRANSIILAGTSAGGTGVMLNADTIRNWLQKENIRANFLGIADSGWFLNRIPFAPTTCFEKDTQKCPPSQSVQMGMKLWSSKLPEACTRINKDERWRCFFGTSIHPSLITPTFIFQWLFDEAQMKADNVGLPLSKFQWNYIRKSAGDLRESFNSSNAVFAPACMSHTVLTKRSWTTVEIDSISLPQAIRCWELSLSPIEHRKRHHKLTIKEGAPTIELSIQLTSSPALLQSDEPRNMSRRKLKNIASPSLPYKIHHKQKNKVKQKNSRNKNKNRRKSERKSKRKETKKKRKNDRKKRRHRKLMDEIRRAKRLTPSPALPKLCKQKLTDSCSWPQCNKSCPKLQNPFSGEEMEFIELLRSFSADLSGLASALGLDPPSLKDISQHDLVRILSQA